MRCGEILHRQTVAHDAHQRTRRIMLRAFLGEMLRHRPVDGGHAGGRQHGVERGNVRKAYQPFRIVAQHTLVDVREKMDAAVAAARAEHCAY